MAGVASLFLYVSVLLVSVTSVLLGLDWLSTPPPSAKAPVQVARTQMPVIKPPVPLARNRAQEASKDILQEAATVAAAAPAAAIEPAAGPAIEAAEGRSAATTGESRAESATAEVSARKMAEPVGGVVPDTSEMSAAGVDGGVGSTENQPSADAAPAPRCDVRACTSAYGSFRASDCTWQPYDGPRRFCDKGTPPRASSALTAARAQAATCNIRACARAYNSFDPSDCTWQPYEGPRQFCEK